MDSILPLLCIISASIWFVRIMSKKEREEHWAEHEARLNEDSSTSSFSSAQDHKDKDPYNIDTCGLMFATLQQFGCQPTTNDDGTISVQYQGENFHMEFGGMYARVWDPMWAGIKADDPDLPNIREAVNVTNFNFGPTVVMTKPDEEGVIGFHSRRDIMLHPACPDNVPFVKAVLDSFFDAKDQVRNNFQQINAQQKEQQKNRRPVGFTTNLNSNE